ncbi:hypothetical protein HELRODRAFT_160692 [Helobdella robusta]|uniref:Uncharacterized protein n=1 Tax=Helobdella robusta TaxID=6412 RepID=T1EQL8_HELRO|nr:hypothetical protein HELRODRAFT_160692 [Helobdella robusta]ESO06511.1 hypothetical protein HELRODRAFT_160692 [Helobdella robusta]
MSTSAGGWRESVMKELQPMKRLSDATGSMYNRARNIYMDVKAKITGEDVMTKDKAVEVLKSELHFPEDRAINFLSRFNKNRDVTGGLRGIDGNSSAADFKLSAVEFNEFIQKVSEIRISTCLPKYLPTQSQDKCMAFCSVL